jgi:hypothetical protein
MPVPGENTNKKTETIAIRANNTADFFIGIQKALN